MTSYKNKINTIYLDRKFFHKLGSLLKLLQQQKPKNHKNQIKTKMLQEFREKIQKHFQN
jgi:hypothetical protein